MLTDELENVTYGLVVLLIGAIVGFFSAQYVDSAKSTAPGGLATGKNESFKSRKGKHTKNKSKSVQNGNTSRSLGEVVQARGNGSCLLPPQDTSANFFDTYHKYVNPRWVDFMKITGFNVEYVRCKGTELFMKDGTRKLDFICSFSVHNVGHNHPHVVQSLVESVTNDRPAILHCCYVPEIAGNLAKMLIDRAVVTGANLRKVLFVNSGTEGIETAIKFSRARTHRHSILYVKTAFHGLTCGALSLSTSPYWYENFGPLLQDVCSIALNDLEALERELKSQKYAAFIMEPILAEAGLYPPSPQFIARAQELCRKHGTLFVLDEVQTGMYRTGTFLLFHQYPGCCPDMVVMAKALSGGLMPVGCVLMADEVYDTVISSTKKSFVQFSTFGENKLSMRAGIATLEVIDKERLDVQTQTLGKYLKDELRGRLLGKYGLVKDVRGVGFLLGIELGFPTDSLYFRTVGNIHPDILATSVSVKLFRDFHILTQVCGNNLFVLKISPPLNVTRQQVDEFIAAVVAVIHEFEHGHTFLAELGGIVSKAIANK